MEYEAVGGAGLEQGRSEQEESHDRRGLAVARWKEEEEHGRTMDVGTEEDVQQKLTNQPPHTHGRTCCT